MKKFLLLSQLLLLNQIVFSQNDVSAFNKSGNDNIAKKNSAIHRYAIYINPSFALRGGATLGVQARIIDGIAISFDYGVSYYDFISRDFFSGTYESRSDEFSEINTLGAGKIVEYAVKYYFSHTMHGGYLSVSNALIQNNPTRRLFNHDFDFANSGSNYYGPYSYKLPYQSKDYKLLFGYSGIEESNFFADINFGIGLRKVKLNYITRSYSYDANLIPLTTVNKIVYSYSNTWLFIGFKLGYKF